MLRISDMSSEGIVETVANVSRIKAFAIYINNKLHSKSFAHTH